MVEHIVTFEESIMPRSTIKNCAKTVLKEDTMIQKEALTALAKGSSVFISYLTTHANEIALSKKRKTIMPNDVFEALKVIEFSRFVPDLKQAHELAEKDAKDRRDRKKSGPVEQMETQTDVGELVDEEDGILPPTKRSKVVGYGSQDIVDGMDEDVEQAESEHEEEEDEVAEEDEDEDEEEAEDNAEEQDETQDPVVVDALDQDMEHGQTDNYDEALDNGEESD